MLFCNNTEDNKRQLSEDRQNSTLTQHDQQLSKKGKTQLQLLKYQEQHGFTKSATMGKRQRIARGFQEDGRSSVTSCVTVRDPRKNTLSHCCNSTL